MEVRNGGTQYADLLGTFCADMPGSIFSTDNTLYIKYRTDTDDPKNGFKAKISIGINMLIIYY